MIGYIFILSPEGKLYIASDDNCFHSYFLMSFEGDSKGKAGPVSCAGEIEIENGKVSYISNLSGHYLPNLDQLIIAIHHLNQFDLFSETVVIGPCDYSDLTLEEVLSVDPDTLLENYR